MDMSALADLCESHDEADDIASNIAARGELVDSHHAARLLATRYMGTPAECGHTIHSNVADALWRLAQQRKGATT